MKFYYIKRNSDNKLELVEASEDDIIDLLQEEITTPSGIGGKYYYDEEDRQIRMWTHGGYSVIVFNGMEFTPEEAKKQLLDLAMENLDGERSGKLASIWSYVYDNPKDLIRDIKGFIENGLDEDDPDYLKTRGELQEIVKQLRKLHKTAIKTTNKKD